MPKKKPRIKSTLAQNFDKRFAEGLKTAEKSMKNFASSLNVPSEKLGVEQEQKEKNVTEVTQETKKDQKPKATIETALIELPLGEVADGEYLSNHVEARLRTKGQCLAMKRLLRGLQQTGAKTEDGRFVQRPGEVIRYIAEQIAKSE